MKIKNITIESYTGKVYDIELEKNHFFYANDILTHNCRLKNAMETNEFSYTLGAGGVMTGSKKVITLNINRIVQDWYNEGMKVTLNEYVATITSRVHKYLEAWNDWLWDLYNTKLLTVYKAGFIDLDKQYLTVGFNGFIEGAEFLATVDSKYNGIEIRPDNEAYKQYTKDILVTIKELNTKDRTEHQEYFKLKLNNYEYKIEPSCSLRVLNKKTNESVLLTAEKIFKDKDNYTIDSLEIEKFKIN